jgi:hypothetical protein
VIIIIIIIRASMLQQPSEWCVSASDDSVNYGSASAMERNRQRTVKRRQAAREPPEIDMILQVSPVKRALIKKMGD